MINFFNQVSGYPGAAHAHHEALYGLLAALSVEAS